MVAHMHTDLTVRTTQLKVNTMIDVSKNMYDKELQRYYTVPGRVLAKFLSRRSGIALYNFLEKGLRGKNTKALDCDQVYIDSKSTPGHRIRVRIFRPKGAHGKLPAMLYLHGGGYMVGNPEQFFSTIEKFFEKRPFVMIAPEYRKSRKNPFPDGFNDCYDTLLWMKENAEKLGVDTEPFMVGGHSAGGGLTAAVTLKARDTQDVKIAFQMPIYPMLDHRQVTESSKNMFKAPMWDSRSTEVGWSLYLKRLNDANEPIPPYASPALCDNVSGMPPTISFVGDLEPFRDEVMNYVEDLKAAGVPVDFKLFKGAFHGFEMVASKTNIAQEADRFLFEAFASYYDAAFPKQ